MSFLCEVFQIIPNFKNILYVLFGGKNLCMSGIMQFKVVLFKDQLFMILKISENKNYIKISYQ